MYIQLYLILFIIIFYLLHFDIIEEPNPNIYFMTKTDTTDFILKDKDNFITNLDSINRIARGVKSNNEYLTIVSKSSTNFTSLEKDKLNTAIRDACDKLINIKEETLKHYGIDKIKLNKLITDWTLSKTKDKVLEMGMPHTRGKIIFLSSYYLDLNIDNNEKLRKTMIHEIIHVYQRTYKEDYVNFLKQKDWIVYPYNKKDKRLNPDLDGLVWKRKKNNKIYVARFNSRNPKDLRDINIKHSNEEHPYEYYAYKLSEHIL